MMRQAQDLGLLSAEGAQRLNEGLDYDVYTNNNKHIDRQKIRAFHFGKFFSKKRIIFALLISRIHAFFVLSG